MLNYRYVPNPKIGDLLGYAQTREIEMVVIVGFSKNGNIRVIPLNKNSIDRFKQGKQPNKYWYNPVKSVAINHLTRICTVDLSLLSKTELDLYNYLINNTPLP
jgi:hypothetical protein